MDGKREDRRSRLLFIMFAMVFRCCLSLSYKSSTFTVNSSPFGLTSVNSGGVTSSFRRALIVCPDMTHGRYSNDTTPFLVLIQRHLVAHHVLTVKAHKLYGRRHKVVRSRPRPSRKLEPANISLTDLAEVQPTRAERSVCCCVAQRLQCGCAQVGSVDAGGATGFSGSR